MGFQGDQQNEPRRQAPTDISQEDKHLTNWKDLTEVEVKTEEAQISKSVASNPMSDKFSTVNRKLEEYLLSGFVENIAHANSLPGMPNIAITETKKRSMPTTMESCSEYLVTFCESVQFPCGPVPFPM
ncbi:hypothetical protein DPMN_133368 [Dreissena polymorpha]|uniref:Uncharacterized protein n=1 Tax=Dreissena polymorpha TaxID=45954 RepID=A0A9D4J9Q0_DREPO|nr:hypothetical protein DPMN_133368 [Dreissena polymorpha]